jgi:hypothetical protein
MNEIRLTHSVSWLVAFRRLKQIHEPQQLVEPQLRTAPAHYLVWIGEGSIGPIHWH